MKNSMRRIVLMLALTACTAGASAQSHFYHLVGDTVYGKSPIYYYDWWPTLDSNYMIRDSIATNIFATQQGFQLHRTSDTLKIIGIASTLTRYIDTVSNVYSDLSNIPEHVDTTYDTNMFYVLYDATPNGPVELKRVHWVEDYMTHPKRYMALPVGWGSCGHVTNALRIAPLREYYFDSPIYMTDSFYLGWQYMRRHNENYTYDPIFGWIDNPDPALEQYLLYHDFINLGLQTASDQPCHIYIPSQRYFTISPNTWYAGMNPQNPIYEYQTAQDYLTIFPIIEVDTTTLKYNESHFRCPEPTNLFLFAHAASRIKVTWDDSGRNHGWQIVLTTSDTISPDSCTAIDCSTTSYDTYTTSPDSTYYIYVRGQCDLIGWDSTAWSPWCGPLQVDALNGPVNPDDPDDSLAIHNVETVSFALSPNPTSSIVTIVTNETEGHVTLLDLQGRHLFDFPLTGNKTIVDLKGITPGTYLVRLDSPRGSSTQKLTVQ